MLASLCGTPFQLQARDAIVVLEEIAEPPYKVDRMLEQLKQSGAFDGVVGFAIGEFFKCAAPQDAKWELSDVIMEHLVPFGVPILGELPIGHGRENYAFPIGATGKISKAGLSWEPV